MLEDAWLIETPFTVLCSFTDSAGTVALYLAWCSSGANFTTALAPPKELPALGSELNSPYIHKSLRAAMFPFSTTEDSVQGRLSTGKTWPNASLPKDGLRQRRQEGDGVLRVGS